MVIAIDGPSGSGKSTTARRVAAALGFRHLDTGAMYRAVALVALDRDLDPVSASGAIRLDPGPPLLLDGEDPGERLRTPEVTAKASEVAALPEVREALVARQREILAEGDWVAEGRDICSTVAPDAEVKVWLTADEVERARRRAGETGLPESEVLAAQRARDGADAGHGRATLTAPEGAILLDTSGLTPDEVTAAIVDLANEAAV